MFGLMVALAVGGLGLLFAAPLLARLLVGGAGDPIGTTRVLQAIAVVLLVVALLVRPHQQETSAFPPSPDRAAPSAR